MKAFCGIQILMLKWCQQLFVLNYGILNPNFSAFFGKHGLFILHVPWKTVTQQQRFYWKPVFLYEFVKLKFGIKASCQTLAFHALRNKNTRLWHNVFTMIAPTPKEEYPHIFCWNPVLEDAPPTPTPPASTLELRFWTIHCMPPQCKRKMWLLGHWKHRDEMNG